MYPSKMNVTSMLTDEKQEQSEICNLRMACCDQCKIILLLFSALFFNKKSR